MALSAPPLPSVQWHSLYSILLDLVKVADTQVIVPSSRVITLAPSVRRTGLESLTRVFYSRVPRLGPRLWRPFSMAPSASFPRSTLPLESKKRAAAALLDSDGEEIEVLGVASSKTPRTQKNTLPGE